MIPVILSGGTGSRLWPLSRERHPKQFLKLHDAEQTLFQATLSRLADLPEIEPPLVVSSVEHRFLAAEQLHALGIKPRELLLEPVGRNTAPAIAAAALIVGGGKDLLLVLPADHVIGDVQAFARAIEGGSQAAHEGALVVFGIVADRPETGFGYIRGAKKFVDGAPVRVAEFVEKPDAEQAKGYVDSGEYLWNSGMFLFRADRYLKALIRHAPAVLAAVEAAVTGAERDLDFCRLAEAPFTEAPDISIDYAVLEHTHEAMVVPLDAGWSDIGTWDALAAVQEPDGGGNVVSGDVLLEDVCGSYVRAEHRLVAALGLRNQIVVETPDAVLVADRSRAQEVRKLVSRLKAEGRRESLFHRRVYRPWGWYEGMVEGERFQVKHIGVNPGATLSLQMHHHRAEHWTVVSGTAEVTRGGEVFLLTEDQSSYIPLGTRHRLYNPGRIPLELIEVQTGSYLGEDDIVRFEDVYGRKGNEGTK